MGRKMALVAAVAMIAGGLASCNRQAATTTSSGLAESGKYCTPFPSTAAATNTPTGLAPAAISDPAASFDDCIHRWGYVLAPSRDPADVVAQAAVEACSSILASWTQQIGQGPDTGRYSRRRESPAPDPAQQQMHAAVGRALFYVVQARAGGCAAPPASTLVTPTAASSSYAPTAAPPG